MAARARMYPDLGPIARVSVRYRRLMDFLMASDTVPVFDGWSVTWGPPFKVVAVRARVVPHRGLAGVIFFRLGRR